MTVQPNFEMLKTLFYRTFVDSHEADNAVILESFSGKLLPSFHVRKENFKKDFNNWLNTLDIRSAGTLVDVLKENEATIKSKGLTFPSWLKNKAYAIDYNHNEALDFIKVTADLEY